LFGFNDAGTEDCVVGAVVTGEISDVVAGLVGRRVVPGEGTDVAAGLVGAVWAGRACGAEHPAIIPPKPIAAVTMTALFMFIASLCPAWDYLEAR